MTPIIVGSVWKLMTTPSIGIIPYMLKHSIGFDLNIGSSALAAFVITVIMDIWHWTPLVTLTLFVAGFIGGPAMNILDGKMAVSNGKQMVVTDQGLELPLESTKADDGQPVTYGIRPEHISIGDGGIPVDVSVLEPTGSETPIFGRAGGVPIDALIRERIEVEPGKTVPFRIDTRRSHVFDRATGQRT